MGLGEGAESDTASTGAIFALSSGDGSPATGPRHPPLPRGQRQGGRRGGGGGGGGAWGEKEGGGDKRVRYVFSPPLLLQGGR